MTDEAAASRPVIVVSGLPRSGTSMMMGMLVAGGVEVLTDAAREADADNPRGYYELEAVKRLRSDSHWLAQARGKAVKVISLLLFELPPEHEYRVIFMERDLREVLASQRQMLRRRSGGAADGAAADSTADGDEEMARVYRDHLSQVRQWLPRQAHIRVLHVDYSAALADPVSAAQAVADFLGGGLDPEAMVAAVDAALYRQRRPEGPDRR